MITNRLLINNTSKGRTTGKYLVPTGIRFGKLPQGSYFTLFDVPRPSSERTTALKVDGKANSVFVAPSSKRLGDTFLAAKRGSVDARQFPFRGFYKLHFRTRCVSP